MRAVRHGCFGPPEVLRWEEVPDPVPGEDQVLIQVSAAGVNYADLLFRSGWAREHGVGPDVVTEPLVPGTEVAGTIVSVGPGVDRELAGRRVAAFMPGGGYAELALASSAWLVRIPDGVSDRTAAALLAQGDTAQGIIERAGLRPGDRVLVEAAGGGVGTLLVQLARRAGAYVVAAARGAPKLEVAKRLGADVVVDYAEPGWQDRVSEATRGRGLDVVFETVGGELARTAMDLLAPDRGVMIWYGFSSGEMPGFTFFELFTRGVQLIPFRARQLEAPDEARRRGDAVLANAAAGELEPVIGHVLPLAEAASAHAAMAARTTIGKVLLVP